MPMLRIEGRERAQIESIAQAARVQAAASLGAPTGPPISMDERERAQRGGSGSAGGSIIRNGHLASNRHREPRA